MMEFKDRLKKSREYAGLSQKQLSMAVEKAGGRLSQPMVSGIEKGERLGSTAILEISEVCKINPTWLKHGTGEMLVNTYPIKTTTDDSDIAIPEYSDVQLSAGHGAIIENEKSNTEMHFKKKWLEERRLTPDNSVVVYVRGDSMSPVMNDGSVILINTNETTIINGKYYALNFDSMALVKMLYKRMDGTVTVKSINPSYQDEEISSDNQNVLRIIGRVVWVGNEL
jgi:phage repressor protein C with HTH and peptisase S24 domain